MEKGQLNKKDQSRKIKNIVLIASGSIIAIVVGKKFVEGIIATLKQNREESQYYDPNKNSTLAQKQALSSQLATKFKTAFNPSGNDWMMSWDQTDERSVFQCARDINKYKLSWAMVSTAYKGVFNRDLTNDLSAELDAAENSLFLSILNAADPDMGYQNAMMKRFGTIDGLANHHKLLK